MNSTLATPNTEASILARLVERRSGALTRGAAEYLLSFSFPEADVARMNALSEGAQLGTLTDLEQAELDSYVHVSNLLALMQSKARRFLADAGHH